MRTETALDVPRSDGRIESATDGVSPVGRLDGRHACRMRAQHHGGRFRLDRVAVLHLPPLLALWARNSIERNFVCLGDVRRPQPNESVPASGQDMFSIPSRRHVRDRCLV